MSKVSITWSTRREGNQGFVLEEYSTGGSQTFVMPSHIVPAFIAARRRLMALAAKDLGATPALSDEEIAMLQENPDAS